MRYQYTRKGVMIAMPKGHSKNVSEDANTAYNLGVSYGKYKAGMGLKTTESDYPVMPTQFVARSAEKTDDYKVKAFIK